MVADEADVRHPWPGKTMWDTPAWDISTKSLAPKQAELLSEAWDGVRKAMEALEELRPAGGFKDLIDAEVYCPHCGTRREGK